MTETDWVPIALAGAGAIMGTLGKRGVRYFGVALFTLGVLGFVVSYFYLGADAQSGPTVTNSGNGNTTLIVPGNGNTINNGSQMPTVGRVAHFQFSEHEIASSDPKLPFALQITILTDQIIEKPAFVITCDGEISRGQAGVGAGVYTMIQQLITDDRHSFGFRWATPDFTPDEPLNVTLFAAGALHCPELKDARLITFVIH
jgi:hypothetical protein